MHRQTAPGRRLAPALARAPLAALALAVPSCGGAATADAAAVQELRGPTMGSGYAVKWHGFGRTPVAAAVEEELAAADRTFSIWSQGSELARFNAERTTLPVPVGERLREAVALALELRDWTDGAFDPTVKPLSDLFRAARRSARAEAGAGTGVAPLPPDAVARALRLVGAGLVRIEGDALVKQAPEVELDLDGIVAGLAADRIGARLRALGVPGFMIDVTGEVLCGGRRPDGRPWRIGIVDPERAEPGREGSLVTVPLRDGALCTSGDYRNAVVAEGSVLAHVFDPRTGRNPAHGVVSASVLAPSCAVADGLATALMVLGPDAAAAALERARARGAPVAAWLVLAPPGGGLLSHTVDWPEAFALDGRPLLRPALPAPVEAERARQLALAEAAAAAAPDDPGAAVWHGRRLGYLGRYREAIAVYTAALARHPDDPRLLRHRGHRHLTVRDLEAARADLQRAAGLTQGRPDEVEPDGLPVPGRPPHTTLQFNVHYHLGLAHWCLGDFAAAERAFRSCLSVAAHDEARVAASHWLWCALRRQGHTAAAQEIVAPIGAQMDVVENRSYHELCRLYRGDLRAQDLEPGPGSAGAALAYGLAHHALVQREPRAEGLLRALAAAADWPAFGVLCAEAELLRLPEPR